MHSVLQRIRRIADMEWMSHFALIELAGKESRDAKAINFACLTSSSRLTEIEIEY